MMTRIYYWIGGGTIALLFATLAIGLFTDRLPEAGWTSVNEDVAETMAVIVEPTELITKDVPQQQAASDPKDVEQETSSSEININTASLEQLDTLPGIGPAKARAIIDYRTTYGPLQTIEQLMEVKGIGPKIFEKLKPFVILTEE